jgi:hypothetical protein
VKTEFLKQNLDKLPGIDCKMIDTLAEAGEIYSYNHGYDKAEKERNKDTSNSLSSNPNQTSVHA